MSGYYSQCPMVANINTNETHPSITSRSTSLYSPATINMNFPHNLLRPLDQWTKQDVQQWIEFCISEYSLADVNRHDFEMNGKALLLLNEESFKQRALRSGDVLYRALQKHNTMIKSTNHQAFSPPLWNNYSFPIPRTIRHFNPSMLSPGSFSVNNFPATSTPVGSHPNLPYLHPVFNYMFNHSDSILLGSNLHQQTSNAFRNPSPSSKTPFSYAVGTSLSNDEKRREIIKEEPVSSPDLPSTLNDLIINQSRNVKTECVDDEDIDVEEYDQDNKTTPNSMSPDLQRDQIKRATQQPNDVTNTGRSTENVDQTRKVHYYQDRVDFRGDILMKPPGAKNCRILWEFLYILLEDPNYESIIHWENREKMVFRIVQAEKLAALWGLQKNRLSMTYEKLSRGMRYYYSNNIISKEQSKRLLYRFMRSPEEIRKSMKRPTPSSEFTLTSMSRVNTLSQSPGINSSDIDNQRSIDDTTRSTDLSTFEGCHQRSLNQIGLLLSQISSKTNNERNSSDLFQKNSTRFLRALSKSDRSNSSSPDSIDSNQDRTSDSEKQYCSPSQSFSSSISSSSTSTKRKQAVPISLKARLSNTYSLNQSSTSIESEKDDQHLIELKKIKTV